MQEPTESIVCPKCGYNLYGIPEFRCPECGFRYDYDAIRSLARSDASATIIAGQIVIVRLAFAAVFITAGLIGRCALGIFWPYVIVVAILWIALAIRWRFYGTSFVPDCDLHFLVSFAILLSLSIAHTFISFPQCSLGVAVVIVASAWLIAFRGFRHTGFTPLSIPPELRKRATRWNVIGVILLLLASASLGLYWL